MLQKDWTVSVHADKAFDAIIRMYTITGQTVYSNANASFAKGMNSENINTKNMQPGLYIVAIETEDGLSNKKVVISR